MSRAAEKRAAESPATTSSEYDAMIEKWVKIQTILDGTEAMRAAEREYLPQHDGESDVAYQERLGRSSLFNLSALTLDSWVGRPFSDPVKLSDDMPDEVSELTEDIDLLGNELNVFARDWFRDGLAKTLSHVLVDFPRTGEIQGRPRTRADDLADNVRPYMLHITPERLFFADATIERGREVLREIRFWETETERVGFAKFERPRIRRMFLNETEEGRSVGVELWEKRSVGKSRKIRWQKIDEWSLGIDEIPLVTYYSNRDGFMSGKPPLLDLVDLNINHWQSTADQTAVITVARFPLLALSGGTDEDNKLTIGPRKWLWTPDPQGRYYYVEHSGQAIGAGRQDLLDLEERMAEYGAEFLKKRPGDVTATARALDSAEATSPLQDATIRFTDAVNRALVLVGKWLNVENPGTVEINTEFGPEEAQAADMNALQAARRNRDISRDTYLEELRRRGVLHDEFDPEEDAEKLEQEAMAFAPPPGPPDEEQEQEEEEETEDDDGGEDA